MFLTKTLLLTMVLTFLNGCGWERKVVARAPSEKTSIEIQQPFPANGWGVRIVLRTKDRTETLYELRGDVFLDFADVVWTVGEDSLAVLTCGTPSIRVAYNSRTSSFMPFSQMEPIIAAHIRSEYGITDRTDTATFDWACSAEGKDAFLHRHPDAKPR